MQDYKIDLHMHSHVSDGELPPGEVVRAAHAAGLRVIALADHDTAAGVEEAQAVAATLPIRVIPALEVSTRWGDHELHILGYYVDPRAELLLAHQEASVLRRMRRMEKMVAKLQGMGIPITYEEVVEAAGPATHSIGRPHLARALLAGGHTRYYGEAFARYISDQGPAFVAEAFPTPAEAIEMIHAAGGVAVWAHPPLELFAEEIQHFVEWRLDGVECYRSMQTAQETLLLERTTRELGLLLTGGSDWHGPHRAVLGDFYVRPEQVRAFLEVGGIGG